MVPDRPSQRFHGRPVHVVGENNGVGHARIDAAQKQFLAFEADRIVELKRGRLGNWSFTRPSGWTSAFIVPARVSKAIRSRAMPLM